MKPADPYGTGAAEHPVVAPREAHAQPDHAARQRSRIVRLDDHVEVVVLHAELDDAEPGSCRGAERGAQFAKAALSAHAGKTGRASEGHVNGVATMMDASRDVSNALSGALD